MNTLKEKMLDRVISQLPSLTFSTPRQMDSGELGVEAMIRGVRLKVFIRTEMLQLELRARLVDEKDQLLNHFQNLGKEGFLRKDDVFLPDRWKNKGMTMDEDEAVKRANLLIEIMHADRFDQLSSEAKLLFD